jgi:hypothetical protein
MCPSVCIKAFGLSLLNSHDAPFLLIAVLGFISSIIISYLKIAGEWRLDLRSKPTKGSLRWLLGEDALADVGLEGVELAGEFALNPIPLSDEKS